MKVKHGNLEKPGYKEIAEKRNNNVKVCLRCHARNAIRATRCRKCGYPSLRLKRKLDANNKQRD